MPDQEHELDLIAQALPEPIFLLDADGRVLDANDGACALFGRHLDNLAGASLPALVASPAASLKAYLTSVAASLQTTPGGISIDKNGESLAYRCDGALLRPAARGRNAVIFLRLRPRAAATGRFRLLSEKIDELGRQVVSRMRTEELLEGQRRVLELIASGAPLAATLDALVRMVERHAGDGMRASILLLDPDGRRLLHGAAPSLPEPYNLAINGLEIGPEVGSCGSAAFHNEPVIVSDIATDARWENYQALAAEHGLAACWSTPIPSRDGTVLGTFAMYYAQPRTPRSDELRLIALITRTAAVAIERDREAAQIRQLLESERKARGEAEAANNAKDEFLALISHELRNPLNAIVGWAKVLSMGEPDEETLNSGIEAIERNADLQARLITEILDYSRIASGKLRLEPEAGDLARLIREMVDSARPEARQQNLALHFECLLPPGELVYDAQRIKQVIVNLLNNAIKFSNAGGRIDVRLDGDQGHARLRVSDQGCGIEPEFLPLVFERFRQGDRSRARQHDGLGLGLAIAQQIVTLHDGTIEAHSDGRDQGCTITVRLPMRSPDTRPDSRPAAAMADLTDLHVLVVDDAADARHLLEKILQRAGARVTTAASGSEALALMDMARPDLILCDIAMPGMDGYTVLRRWRARENGAARIPAIALTAYARESDRQQAYAAGFDEHMAKPVDPVRLLTVARRVTANQTA